jgi:hypothetical protein
MLEYLADDPTRGPWKDGELLFVELPWEPDAPPWPEIVSHPDVLEGVRRLALGVYASEAEADRLARAPALGQITELMARHWAMGSAHALYALLRSPHLGGLRRLDVSHHLEARGAELARELASADHLDQLHQLDVPGVGLDFEALSLLLRAPHLQSLRYLRVGSNGLGRDALLALERFHEFTGCAVDVLGQRAPLPPLADTTSGGGEADPLFARAHDHLDAHTSPTRPEWWRAWERIAHALDQCEPEALAARLPALTNRLEQLGLARRMRRAPEQPTDLRRRLLAGASPLAPLFTRQRVWLTDDPTQGCVERFFAGDLRSGNALEHLTLEAHSESGSVLHLLGPLVTSPHLDRLETLSLRLQVRAPGDIASTIEALGQNPSLAGLTCLDLEDSAFGDEDAVALADACRGHLGGLRELRIHSGERERWPQLTDRGLGALARSPLTDTLERLWLDEAGSRQVSYTDHGLVTLRRAARQELEIGHHLG